MASWEKISHRTRLESSPQSVNKTKSQNCGEFVKVSLIKGSDSGVNIRQFSDYSLTFEGSLHVTPAINCIVGVVVVDEEKGNSRWEPTCPICLDCHQTHSQQQSKYGCCHNQQNRWLDLRRHRRFLLILLALVKAFARTLHKSISTESAPFRNQ